MTRKQIVILAVMAVIALSVLCVSATAYMLQIKQIGDNAAAGEKAEFDATNTAFAKGIR